MEVKIGDLVKRLHGSLVLDFGIVVKRSDRLGYLVVHSFGSNSFEFWLDNVDDGVFLEVIGSFNTRN